MDRVRNEEVQRITGVTRELIGRAEQSVLRWFVHGENGGGLVGEENSRIQCKRSEVERKAINGMDRQCEKSVA